MSDVNLQYLSAESVKAFLEEKDCESPANQNPHYDTLDESVSFPMEHFELPIVAQTSGKKKNVYMRYVPTCDSVSIAKNDTSKADEQNNHTDTTENRKVHHDHMNLPKGISRSRKSTACLVILSVAAGIVCGIVVSSVCWLTVDKLREQRIECSLKMGDKLETIAGTTTTLRSAFVTTANKSSSVTFSAFTTKTTASTTEIQTQTTQTRSPIVSTTASKNDSTTSRAEATTAPLPTVQTNLSMTSHHPSKRSIRGGFVYIRWGRLDCPSFAEQVYKGYVAVVNWQQPGDAASTLCVPEVSDWANYSDDSAEDRNLVHGTEYGSSDKSFMKITGKQLRDTDVPCTACQAQGRMSQTMLPGRNECSEGWAMEYRGYHMSSSYDQGRAQRLICVDSLADYTTGGSNNSGNFLSIADFRFKSKQTTSHVNRQELPCVVCTM